MPLPARLLRAACRFSPLYSGCGTLASTPLFRAALGTTGGIIEGRLQGDLRLLTPLDDYVGRALYFFGDLDPKITWICRRVVRPGDTVLDIGANVGLITNLCARLTGPTGVVHAFEPQPDLTRLIARSLRLNRLSNVEIHECALGEDDFESVLQVPDDNRGSASIVRDQPAARRVPVRVHHASDYLARLHLGPLRLVKLDVEGYEAQVLEGAAEFFRSNRPDFILLELNDRSTPFADQPAIRVLRSLDYRFAGIPRSLLRMHLSEIHPTSRTLNHGHDVLAIGSEQAYETIRDRIH